MPEGDSRIELRESTDDLFVVKQLNAHASPRFPSHVYPKYLGLEV